MSEIPTPIVDAERCDGCGRCVEVCPEGALQLATGSPTMVTDDRCDYCGLCEEACPAGAIALVYEIVMGGGG
jgi:thioredoxin reductase (NADPH)